MTTKIQLIHCTPTAGPYWRGKDTAGKSLCHEPGRPYFLVAGQNLTGINMAVLHAAFPGSERVVAAELLTEFNRCTKADRSDARLQATRHDYSLPVAAAEPEPDPEDGNAPARTQQAGQDRYLQLKKLCLEHGLEATGKMPELEARLTDAGVPLPA